MYISTYGLLEFMRIRQCNICGASTTILFHDFNHIREFTNEDNSRHPADTILSDSHKFQKSAHFINKRAINILIESLHIAINFSD
jgi:hypothetical protein